MGYDQPRCPPAFSMLLCSGLQYVKGSQDDTRETLESRQGHLVQGFQGLCGGGEKTDKEDILLLQTLLLGHHIPSHTYSVQTYSLAILV